MLLLVFQVVSVAYYQGIDLDASSLVDIKMLTVNETLGSETETRPRRDRDRDLPRFLRDRDETETLKKKVSRPSRDRDVETETTSLDHGEL